MHLLELCQPGDLDLAWTAAMIAEIEKHDPSL
jgi:hypothetical protein